MSEHLSDLALDALRREGADAGRAHLEACELCRARQAELATADRHFEARFSPAQLAAEIRERVDAPPRRRWGFAAPALALAGAAAFVIFVRPAPETETLRTKGDPALFSLFLRSKGERRPVTGVVDREAHLELRVTATGFARVLWRSADGRWSSLYPEASEESWSVAPGGAWLPREVVLDGAPETERLGVVVCATRFGEAEARALLEGTSEPGCRAHAQELRKR